MKENKQNIIIEIDAGSGFCFGVTNAIELAEKELLTDNKLMSLGKIVHNSGEVDRLSNSGMVVIDDDKFAQLTKTKVLFRAHGEPPQRYKTARDKGIQIIDGTCPVVLKLQQRVKEAYEKTKSDNGQVIIFGKKGHAEVNGLLGQTNYEAIVISDISEINSIDFNRVIHFFSQTTRSVEEFNQIADEIKKRANTTYYNHDTICRQVSNRAPRLQIFAKQYDVIIFVAGTDSSNGKYLFNICKKENPNTYFVSSVKDIKMEYFTNALRIGICGATSTPQWQMEDVSQEIKRALTK